MAANVRGAVNLNPFHLFGKFRTIRMNYTTVTIVILPKTGDKRFQFQPNSCSEIAHVLHSSAILATIDPYSRRSRLLVPCS